MLNEADLADIDEALRHLSLVPDSDRGPAWHAYSDALLERRRQFYERTNDGHTRSH